MWHLSDLTTWTRRQVWFWHVWIDVYNLYIWYMLRNLWKTPRKSAREMIPVRNWWESRKKYQPSGGQTLPQRLNAHTKSIWKRCPAHLNKTEDLWKGFSGLACLSGKLEAMEGVRRTAAQPGAGSEATSSKGVLKGLRMGCGRISQDPQSYPPRIAHILPGLWFQPLWKIVVSWDHYSKYMEKCSKPSTNYTKWSQTKCFPGVSTIRGLAARREAPNRTQMMVIVGPWIRHGR